MTRRLFFRCVAGLASLPYLGPLLRRAPIIKYYTFPDGTVLLPKVFQCGITITVKIPEGYQFDGWCIQGPPGEIDNFTTGEYLELPIEYK